MAMSVRVTSLKQAKRIQQWFKEQGIESKYAFSEIGGCWNFRVKLYDGTWLEHVFAEPYFSEASLPELQLILKEWLAGNKVITAEEIPEKKKRIRMGKWGIPSSQMSWKN